MIVKNTKERLMTFLSQNTNYTAIELMSYLKRDLYKILEENHLEVRYKMFLDSLEKPLYLVDVTNKEGRRVLEYSSDTKKSAVEELQNKGYSINHIVLKHGNHYCKCCGGIASGSAYDVLCKECQNRYQVKRFIELKGKVS